MTPAGREGLLDAGAFKCLADALNDATCDCPLALPHLLDSMVSLVDAGRAAVPIADDGCLLAVALTLQSRAADVHVMSRACQVVKCLARRGANVEAKAAREALLLCTSVFVTALAVHGTEPDMVIIVCDAMANLAASPSFQAALAHAGAVPRLASLMDAHSTNPEVLEAASATLLNLVDLQANHVAAVWAGIPARMSAALGLHTAHAALAEAATGVLLNLADAAEEETLRAIVSAGAIPPLVAALAAHPTSPAVVDGVSGVTLALLGATCLDKCVRSERAAALVVAGAIRALANALSRVTDDRAQQGAMEALAAIADRGRGSGSFPHDGCLLIIRQVLRESGSKPRLVEAAARAVWFFARDKLNAASVATEGILPLLVTACREYAVTDVPATIAAVTALWCCACEPTTDEQMHNAGATAVIVSLLPAATGLYAGDNATLVSTACNALGAIAQSKAGKAAIIDASGVASVLRCLNAFPASEEVVEAACLVLNKVAALPEAKAILEEGKAAQGEARFWISLVVFRNRQAGAAPHSSLLHSHPRSAAPARSLGRRCRSHMSVTPGYILP